MNFLGLLLLELALLVKIVRGTRGNAVPVDFFVFLGRDGDKENVAPRTSMNVNPPDNVIGFPALCAKRCPVFQVDCGNACLAPQMRWCPCVAELLVEDLANDFKDLLGAGSSPVFTLGDYVELSKGQDFFDVQDGHSMLYKLMDADGAPYSRRSGRLAVWVANHVKPADDPNSMLAGTTLLDQPLWQGGEGAGVLLSAQIDRSGKILSHEVGHVVGFHHTAGPSLMYNYDHPECPKKYRHVESHPLVFPTCDVNIMGYWYDGPYCCPGESPSFLLQLRGRSRRNQCLAHSLTNFKEAHCCGSECVHNCPKEMPEPIFATKNHKDPLEKMLRCWLHLRTVPEGKSPPEAVGMMNVTNVVHRKSKVECFDYGGKWGSCITVP